MIRIQIIGIGKTKSGPEQELFSQYQKRLVWPVTLVELELKKSIEDRNKRLAAEAELLTAQCPSHAVRIVLDERGDNPSSVEFSQWFQQFADQGRRDVAFFIGGPDGHDAKLRQSADKCMSFGKMTWPHLMVRVLLIEQIYRAQTILSGHPYHRI